MWMSSNLKSLLKIHFYDLAFSTSIQMSVSFSPIAFLKLLNIWSYDCYVFYFFVVAHTFWSTSCSRSCWKRAINKVDIDVKIFKCVSAEAVTILSKQMLKFKHFYGLPWRPGGPKPLLGSLCLAIMSLPITDASPGPHFLPSLLLVKEQICPHPWNW